MDIPPSMRPFVYDFGHLHEEAENNYIKQIVFNHVRKPEYCISGEHFPPSFILQDRSAHDFLSAVKACLIGFGARPSASQLVACTVTSLPYKPR